MSEKSNQTRFNQMQSNWWYGPITAFFFGVIIVLFLTLLGGTVEQATELIDVSGIFITGVKMSSIGLGIGYYLGDSLKKRQSGKSWFLLGVFFTLTVLTIRSVDILIFDQYPVYWLLGCGGLLSIFAHITPFVAENEEYMSYLKYTSGYGSTAIVTILAISEYLLTSVDKLSNWFQQLQLPAQAFVVIFSFFIMWVVVQVASYEQQQNNSR